MHQAFSRLAGSGLIAAGLALAGCAATSSGLDHASTAVQRVGQLPPPTPTNTGVPEFRLGPYDHIVVEVLAAPELKRDGRVDGSGAFSFPLIGTLQAAGLTPDELAGRIADGLRGRFVRDPQVTVSVQEVVSQVVTVDGEVREPGRYAVPGRMTLQQAIASAHGLTTEANITEVVVFRTVGARQMAALFSLKDIREGRYPDPLIYSQDTVVVGTSRARRLFQELAQISPLFGVFTPLIYFFNSNHN
jgi:polysaccharide biosynthesis/export protein